MFIFINIEAREGRDRKDDVQLVVVYDISLRNLIYRGFVCI